MPLLAQKNQGIRFTYEEKLPLRLDGERSYRVPAMTELHSLVKAIKDDLGEPDSWPPPVEFRDSLALCALNSVYSLRASSSSAANVLKRYRDLRPTAGTDSGPDLLQAMDKAGGPEAFAREVLQNGSKLPGTTRLRTIGIYEGLTRLGAANLAVTTAAQLRGAAGDVAVKKAWQSVVGFGPQSWSYLLMNAGVDREIKLDVMVLRFITRALGLDRVVSSERGMRLLLDAAAELDVRPRMLDRAMWCHESPYEC